MAEQIRSFRELRVYQNALSAAMEIFELTKSFPKEEKYSMVDQMRKSSRSVCANIAEAWRKRRYRAAFVAKMNDAEGEAGETQVWLDFALHCKYIDAETMNRLDQAYEIIISQIVRMIDDADKWVIRNKR